MKNLIGQTIGRYHILEQPGEGGMATVYKAYDTRLDVDVAVKVIRTDALPQNILERSLKRFELEAKRVAKLNHPNIVKVMDYGEHEGTPYLVMPFLSGGTLKNVIKRGHIPWQDAIRMILPIARALEFAHQQGIIHRDVKPSNILITEGGEPMLTDFGIAKVLEDDSTVDHLTSTNSTVGTPAYMAPEQWLGKPGYQSDIYSLGVVIFEMLTGRVPYVADTPQAIMLKQASDPLPRPRQFSPGLPDKVEKVILKALAKDVANRYQRMAEFVLALEKLGGGKTPQGEWIKRLVISFSIGGILLLAGFWWNLPIKLGANTVIGEIKTATITVVSLPTATLTITPRLDFQPTKSPSRTTLPPTEIIEKTATTVPTSSLKVNINPSSTQSDVSVAGQLAYLDFDGLKKCRIVTPKFENDILNCLDFKGFADYYFSPNGQYFVIATSTGWSYIKNRTIFIQSIGAETHYYIIRNDNTFANYWLGTGRKAG